MIRWKKIHSEPTPEGQIIDYLGVGTNLRIETRFEAFPRKNGKGIIYYPFYQVLDDGEVIERFRQLFYAKKWAEEAYDRGEIGHFEVRR